MKKEKLKFVIESKADLVELAFALQGQYPLVLKLEVDKNEWKKHELCKNAKGLSKFFAKADEKQKKKPKQNPVQYASTKKGRTQTHNTQADGQWDDAGS